jgi:hypothetical protein
MSRSVVSLLVTCATVLSLTGCQASKSSNPLSASVAGPIPGVNITAPKLIDPTGGARIAVDKQPLTLVVENASTSGVRPLSYVFEVATDAGFTSKVFVRDSIAPGEGGRTSLRLPDPLATGRSYYWRARAQDGANASDYSAGASFNVFTPIIIDVPNLILPAVNATVDSLRPRFTVGNAPRTGPAGAITYQIELADTDSFANKIAVWAVGEQPNQTSLDTPQDLAYGKVYYWHVRAADPTTVGPWSRTQAFATPAPAPPPPPTGGPGLDLRQAIIVGTPFDYSSWPVTTTITSLELGATGIRVEFSKKDGPGRWPDVIPPGFSGPIEYCMGLAFYINGRWYASAPIEMWNGRDRAGGPPQDYAMNWFYDPARWAPMTGHQPAVGEQIGFFVVAGDTRAFNSRQSVQERSNVVLVRMPTSGGASFTFSGSGVAR